MTVVPDPFVSVVIPTYQRPEALGRCVASLVAQDYPQDRFEVIVVDDGGASHLADLVATHSTLRLTLLAVPHGGPGAARNRGVAAASGEILAFIDDDCTADVHWLSALVAQLGQQQDGVIGGMVANADPGNSYVRASHTLLAFLYRYYHVERRGRLPFFTTNNLGVRTDVFERVGGFDASFAFASEDRDWSDRCLHRGHPLVYAPDALVWHASMLSLAGFARLHFRYGGGAWRFHRVRARRRGHRAGVESFDFYSGMLRAPFVGGDPQPMRQSLLLIASQAVAALGYLWSALRHRVRTARQDGAREGFARD